MLLFLVSLFISTAQAYDSLGFGLGITNTDKGNYYLVSLGDDNHFDQREVLLGARRYGSGRTAFEFGNGFGVNLSAYTGAALVGLKEYESGFAPQLGFDFGGRISLNTNGIVRNYYQWFPGLSLGPQFGWNGNRVLIIAKLGVAVGNFDENWIWPDFYISYGTSTYAHFGQSGVGLDLLRFGDNTLYAIDGFYNFKDFTVDLRLESLDNIPRGIRDTRGAVLIRFNVFGM